MKQFRNHALNGEMHIGFTFPFSIFYSLDQIGSLSVFFYSLDQIGLIRRSNDHDNRIVKIRSLYQKHTSCKETYTFIRLVKMTKYFVVSSMTKYSVPMELWNVIKK